MGQQEETRLKTAEGTVAINAIHLDRVPEFSYDALWWERSLRECCQRDAPRRA